MQLFIFTHCILLYFFVIALYFIEFYCFFFQEARLARDEAGKMASMAESESQRCLDLERRMMMEMQDGNESLPVTAQYEEMAKKDR